MNDSIPAALPDPGQLAFPVKKVGSTDRLNSAAIIAKAKGGKTYLGASASLIPQLVAANKKTLIMSTEGGSASVARAFPDADVAHFSHHAGFNRGLLELYTKKHDYGVVVIDTYDGFQGYAETFFLSNAGGDTRAAYGLLKKWTIDTAWELHHAPFTVIFLFHEDMVKDERSGLLERTFKLVGSAGERIGEVFDLIGHLTVEDGPDGTPQRVLQLGPKAGYVTGNRWEDLLPAKMVNATMSDIFAIIRPVVPNNTTAEN